MYDGPLAKLFPEEGFFAKVVGQNRIFTFPVGYHLGHFVSWNNGEHMQKPAIKTVAVPANAHVSFIADETVNLDSYLLSLFRSDDLWVVE